MRNFVVILAIAIVLIGCDDSFEPNSEYKDIYIVNCLIDGDSTNHNLTILKSYEVEDNLLPDGSDPEFISGAEVFINHGENRFQFEEVSKNGKTQYQLENFEYKWNETLNLEVSLPGNKTVSATTTFPDPNKFLMIKRPAALVSDEEGLLSFSWKYNSIKQTDLSFLPHLKVQYSLKSENDAKVHEFEIPTKYIEVDNKLIAVEPAVTQYESINYSKETIETAFEEIASRYDSNEVKILGSKFTLYLSGPNLTAYLSSIQKPLEGYTIVLNETDFTNLKGARGIFGTYFRYKIEMIVPDAFVKKYKFRF